MLREMTDWLRDELGSAVVALGAVLGDKPNLLAAVTEDLVTRGLHAGKIVKAAASSSAAAAAADRRSRRPAATMRARLQDALESVYDLVGQKLGGA